jgi:hypothetical protein
VSADDDNICIDEGVCVVIETKLVASTCFIDGDASGPPDEVGSLLLCICPEFCGAAEGIGKGSMGEEGRNGECSALVSEKSDETLRNHTPLFRRVLQNHIKPTTTKATSTKKPTTPPTIGPIITVDLPLALLELVELDIADVVNVPDPPELDAGTLDLDALDVAAEDEAPVVVVDLVGVELNFDKTYGKPSNESRWYSWKGGTYGGYQSRNIITIIWTHARTSHAITIVWTHASTSRDRWNHTVGAGLFNADCKAVDADLVFENAGVVAC